MTKVVWNASEPWHEISDNVVCATSKASDQPALTPSLIRAFASRLNILWLKLLNEHHFDFLCLKGGCTGSSKSTFVKMPHCWKSHVTAHLINATDVKRGRHFQDKILVGQSITFQAKNLPLSLFHNWTIEKLEKTQISISLKKGKNARS